MTICDNFLRPYNDYEPILGWGAAVCMYDSDSRVPDAWRERAGGRRGILRAREAHAHNYAESGNSTTLLVSTAGVDEPSRRAFFAIECRAKRRLRFTFWRQSAAES